MCTSCTVTHTRTTNARSLSVSISVWVGKILHRDAWCRRGRQRSGKHTEEKEQEPHTLADSPSHGVLCLWRLVPSDRKDHSCQTGIEQSEPLTSSCCQVYIQPGDEPPRLSTQSSQSCIAPCCCTPPASLPACLGRSSTRAPPPPSFCFSTSPPPPLSHTTMQRMSRRERLQRVWRTVLAQVVMATCCRQKRMYLLFVFSWRLLCFHQSEIFVTYLLFWMLAITCSRQRETFMMNEWQLHVSCWIWLPKASRIYT